MTDSPKNPLTHGMRLSERCRIHAHKMDEEGHYVTANVLSLAADALEASADDRDNSAASGHCNPLHDGRNPNHGRVGGLRDRAGIEDGLYFALKAMLAASLGQGSMSEAQVAARHALRCAEGGNKTC